MGACLLCRGWSLEGGVYACRGRVLQGVWWVVETGRRAVLGCRVRYGRSLLLGGQGSRVLHRHLRGLQWRGGKRAFWDLRRFCRRSRFRAMLSASLRILDVFFSVVLRRRLLSQRDRIRHLVYVGACRC